jgi:hypothetical protein
VKRHITALALACAFASALPSAAAGASSPVIADCNLHGHLTQRYSVSQLHTALIEMPADVQEYTDCYDVIQRALLAQVSGVHRGGKTSAASSGSFLPTPVIIGLALVVVAGGIAGGLALGRRG